MLILSIAEDFDKLLQDGSVASVTTLGKLCRVVKVAVYLVFVLVIRVLRTKHCRAHGARKVLNMVLAIQGRNIRASEGAATGMTQKFQSSEVVSLAQWILLGFVFIVDRKEFGSYNLATILDIS